MLGNQENNLPQCFPYRNSTPFTPDYRCSRFYEVVIRLLTLSQTRRGLPLLKQCFGLAHFVVIF